MNQKTKHYREMERHAGRAEAMLKQLANAKRLLILCQLLGGEETVLELAAHVGLSQSALSQHLLKMKAAGLVQSEKRGQKVYYSIQSSEVRTILSVLHGIYCAE